MNTEQFKQWCQSYQSPHLQPKTVNTLIMGILNVTPDSFSDGGQFESVDLALKHALALIEEGADIIDIGGESSRPGAESLSVEEELGRVIPIIEQLRAHSDICISIDTTKPQVMRAALSAGANILNDISGFRDPSSVQVAVEFQAPLCLMHMQGEPRTMQVAPNYYPDVVSCVHDYFAKQQAELLAAGIKPEQIVLDPGFGFGKTTAHNLQLVQQLASFHKYQRPLMLGVSRKSTLGEVLRAPVTKRLAGGIALAVYGVMQGLSLIRTHEVAETKQAIMMIQAIRQVADNHPIERTQI